jgi:hypothetical protein
MKTLFLVHVEDMFRDFFPDSMYIPRLKRAMQVYDQVYCFVSEVMDDDIIPELMYPYRTHTKIHWGWGYEPGMGYDDGEDTWTIPVVYGMHEWTWVPPELRNPEHWANCEISVGGGCREECLGAFRSVLDHVEIPHRVVDGYCY